MPARESISRSNGNPRNLSLVDLLALGPQRVSDEDSPAVWGVIATVLWAAVIEMVFLVVQILAAVTYVATTPDLSHESAGAALHSLTFGGTVLSVSTLATLLVGVPVIAGIAKLKRGSKPKDYLGLTLPRLRQFLQWSLITSVFCCLAGLILSLLPRETASHFFFDAYSSANPRWILWLAVAVAAPITEEIFFRGFLFKGLAASRLRWYGAAVITSFLWTAIHPQADWAKAFAIFAFGLILGTVRATTNSTLLTIWLHCLVNLLALTEMAIVLGHMPVNN